DTGLTPATSYSYQVRATDAAANLGPYSNTFTATTQTLDTQPPSAPGTLTATSASASEIDLSWGAASDDLGGTGYQVVRGQGAGGNELQQHRSFGKHELQLPGARGRRRGQPGRVLEHGDCIHSGSAGHAAAVTAGDVDSDRRRQQPDQPELGCGERQRRSHR